MAKRNIKFLRKKTAKSTKRKSLKRKTLKRKSLKRKTNKQSGGSDCSIATVIEPGFSVPSHGDIAGLSIGESRGVIYRPNCKSDNYQAMTP